MKNFNKKSKTVLLSADEYIKADRISLYHIVSLVPTVLFLLPASIIKIRESNANVLLVCLVVRR